MDNNCPCCQPPWKFTPGIRRRFTHLKLDADQNLIWLADNTVTVNRIRHSSGAPILAGGYAELVRHQVRGIAPDSSLIWNVDEIGSIGGPGLSVGASGRIVTTPRDDTVPTLRVRDSDRNLLWEKSLVSPSLHMRYLDSAIDGSDNVYATMNHITEAVRAFDPDGNPLWHQNIYTLGQMNAIEVNDTRVAVVGTSDVFGGPAVRVSHSDTGTTIWQASPFNIQFLDCAFLSDGGLVAVGRVNDDGEQPHIFRYSDSGTLLWTRSHGRSLFCVAVDTDDNIYVAGEIAWTTIGTGGPNTRCFDKDGNLLWSYDSTFGKVFNDFPQFVPLSMCLDGDGNIYQAGTRAEQPVL